MASQIEAIDVKRKMFFEHEGTPFHCIDVEVSKPTARGGQTLVRIKMRNLLTRAVFDKTFKAGDKFKEPDLTVETASYIYSDASGFNFMNQETFETITLSAEIVGDAAKLLADNLNVDIQRFNGRPIGLELPPHVELAVTYTEPGVRGDTASGKASASRCTPKRASSRDARDPYVDSVPLCLCGSSSRTRTSRARRWSVKDETTL